MAITAAQASDRANTLLEAAQVLLGLYARWISESPPRDADACRSARNLAIKPLLGDPLARMLRRAEQPNEKLHCFSYVGPLNAPGPRVNDHVIPLDAVILFLVAHPGLYANLGDFRKFMVKHIVMASLPSELNVAITNAGYQSRMPDTEWTCSDLTPDIWWRAAWRRYSIRVSTDGAPKSFVVEPPPLSMSETDGTWLRIQR